MLKQVPRAAGTACFYLNAVSPEGQELFWLCDPPARRPPYRTSRILARHQLVTKIQQGLTLILLGENNRSIAVQNTWDFD
ncbi:hypothetical protein DUI87_16684 [Hirundo rustica rustica]|uniref:Uncharacterized protein n=1 Tax=Hirundo rustica rustica TaxID=333673 RepID=A0A3M0K2J4_HIRRU|nr:hypothetical protein DUI87_16684 [Hirundo rustica rustica]